MIGKNMIFPGANGRSKYTVTCHGAVTTPPHPVVWGPTQPTIRFTYGSNAQRCVKDWML